METEGPNLMNWNSPPQVEILTTDSNPFFYFKLWIGDLNLIRQNVVQRRNSRSANLFPGYFSFSDYFDQAGRNGGLRILSLDGGGIRGLVLIKILTALVQHSKEPVYTNILLINKIDNPALPTSFPFWGRSNSLSSPFKIRIKSVLGFMS